MLATDPRHSVDVRPATTDDIEFMVHLFLELARQRSPSGEGMDVDAIVQGTREGTLEQVQGKLANSTTNVIEFNGQRVGRLRVVRTDDEIKIAGIQILPNFQSLGIGSTVITELIREAMNKALPIVLEVDKDNQRPESLYLRLGFERYGETETTFQMRNRADEGESDVLLEAG